MEPIINSSLPEFKVQAFHNGSFKTVSSDDVKGKWAIFFFYPADFTFVCPTELVDIAEKYEQFQAMGVEVYSVSTDSHFVHKAWHDASDSIRKIKYPMLADPTGALSRGFGVMIEDEGMAYRGTFVVNPEGRIKIAEIHDNNIGATPTKLLRKVEAAQFVASHDGEVCRQVEEGRSYAEARASIWSVRFSFSASGRTGLPKPVRSVLRRISIHERFNTIEPCWMHPSRSRSAPFSPASRPIIRSIWKLRRSTKAVASSSSCSSSSPRAPTGSLGRERPAKGCAFRC